MVLTDRALLVHGLHFKWQGGQCFPVLHLMNIRGILMPLISLGKRNSFGLPASKHYPDAGTQTKWLRKVCRLGVIAFIPFHRNKDSWTNLVALMGKSCQDPRGYVTVSHQPETAAITCILHDMPGRQELHEYFTPSNFQVRLPRWKTGQGHFS